MWSCRIYRCYLVQIKKKKTLLLHYFPRNERMQNLHFSGIQWQENFPQKWMCGQTIVSSEILKKIIWFVSLNIPKLMSGVQSYYDRHTFWKKAQSLLLILCTWWRITNSTYWILPVGWCLTPLWCCYLYLLWQEIWKRKATHIVILFFFPRPHTFAG